VSMGTFGDVAPVITLGSMSKRWLVPGWRLGWLAIHDPHATLKTNQFVGRLKKYTNICGGPATFIQAAVPAIIEERQEVFFKKTLYLLEKAAQFCYEKIEKIDGLSCSYKPQGSMMFMVKVNVSELDEISDDVDFCFKLAREESLIILPGSIVGLKDWIRISFAVDASSLEEAMERLQSFCERRS
ncbi:tyrosine aminotransferase, partial [Genlisea aurea]